MKTRIIVDSTADLVPEIEQRVHIVPLTVHFGQEEYIDGVTIDHKTFYEKLVESDVLPTTSQATPDAFMKEFDKVKEAGEAAVVITLASKFSGTYQSATIAAEDYENIYIVDSASAAMGSGILVELAFRLLDKGKSAEEIATILEGVCPNRFYAFANDNAFQRYTARKRLLGNADNVVAVQFVNEKIRL